MDNDKKINTTRRNMLKGTAALAAGAVIAPGVTLFGYAQAKNPDEAVTDAVRWGMLIDVNQCANDCDDCVTACNKTNGLKGFDRPLTDPQWIRKLYVKDQQTGHEFSLPMMCQHCEKPPCVDVCPTGASFRRVDGIVLVDSHICIGCRYCMMACPYKARSFVHETLTDQKVDAPRGKGTVEACDMCVTNVDDGELPDCVTACNKSGHKAMIFGDLNDPNSEISQALKKHGGRQIRADLGLNTGVRYQGI